MESYETVKFGDTVYHVVINGVNRIRDEKLTLALLVEGPLEEMEANVKGHEEITVYASDGSLLRTETGFTQLSSARHVPEYEIGEDAEGEMHTADVLIVELARPDISAQVAKNTANIDYLAMMTDVELEEV